jgi:molybdopterin synthase catalytic subunit
MIRVQPDPIEAGVLLDAFQAGRTDIGAVVCFTGLVRDASGGTEVSTLELDHYPGFTEAALADIETEARRRWDLIDTLIVHRHGRMAPGDTIVLCAASSAHRRAAFEAADFMMDALKTDAPFWKKESGPEGERWIEPREQDHSDRARWRANR